MNKKREQIVQKLGSTDGQLQVLNIFFIKLKAQLGKITKLSESLKFKSLIIASVGKYVE